MIIIEISYQKLHPSAVQRSIYICLAEGNPGSLEHGHGKSPVPIGLYSGERRNMFLPEIILPGNRVLDRRSSSLGEVLNDL
jgi:hypothetical protein